MHGVLTVLAVATLVGQLPPPPPPPQPRTEEADAPWVHVTLKALPGVRLGRIPTASRDISIARYMWLDERPTWECEAPCNKRIRRADDTFVVGAADMADSETFSLVGADAMVVEVHSGSRALKVLGVLSTVFGAIGLGAGIILTIAAATLSGGTYVSPVLAPGLVGIGLGAVLMVGGIISINLSKTRVDVSVAPGPGAPATTVATFWRD